MATVSPACPATSRHQRRPSAADRPLLHRDAGDAAFQGRREMTGLDRFVFSFFNVDIAARYWVSIAEGFVVTTYLGLAVIAAGIPLGLLLAALRSFRIRPGNVLVVVFADVFRSLPPLMVIIILFFAFPYL